MKEVEAVKLLEASNLFDARWYKDCYPDVEMTKIPAALHYLRYGWLMMRDPSSSFSTSAYLEKNSDVKNQALNPLVHYINNGRKEGRECFPSGTSIVKNEAKNKNLKQEGGKPSNDAISEQLEETQALLEHYFNRCRELEYSLLDQKTEIALVAK